MGFFVDKDTALLPVVDLASPDNGVAALPDRHPRIGIAEDVAVLYRALAVPPDKDAVLLPIVDPASPDDGVGRGAMNGHTRERIGRNLAVLQHQSPLGDVHGVVFVSLQTGPAAQRKSTHRGVFCLHQDATRVRTLDDDFLHQPVADDLQRLVDDETFVVKTRAHKNMGARPSTLDSLADRGILPPSLFVDNEGRCCYLAVQNSNDECSDHECQSGDPQKAQGARGERHAEERSRWLALATITTEPCPSW